MPMRDPNVDFASRYLANTLHEIRTPIQTIISTVELMQDTELDKEQTEYLRQIQFSADVLLDLANNILDFTKIRSKEFKLESIPFDIAGITEQVVDLISIEAFNKGIEIVTTISADVPQMVSGDPVRVQQIMLNLIKNAVKFTHNGYIHVELSYTEDERIFFQITDSGIGISEQNRKRLFTDYFQADISTYRKFGGTGLGLSICKNLMSVMGGEIGVKANPYGGSVFWFSVPFPKAVERADDLALENIPPDTRILVVDDNDLARRNFTDKLRALGLRDIVATASADDAINQLIFAERVKSPFTLAFIDMSMPLMDGWHLASEIMNNKELKGTVSLFLLIPEGQMHGEAKMKLLDWFRGYIYKPVKLRKLRDLLHDTFTNFDDIEILECADVSAPAKGAEPEAPAPAPLQMSNEVAVGFKILIAEDHPVNRKIIEAFLKGFGADVLIAEDGEQAVEQVAAHPETDMIFMDIFMPKKSGVEASDELRKKGYKGIIIACTANNDSKDFEDYMKIGINDILVKPFKRAMVKSMLEKWSTVMAIPRMKEITTLIPVHEPVVKTRQIWNRADFLDTVGGSGEFGVKLLEDYLTQLDGLYNDLCKNSADFNFAEVKKIGHTIKGSSGSISAEELSELGKNIEFAAGYTDMTAILKNQKELVPAMERFKSTVAEFMRSGGNDGLA